MRRKDVLEQSGATWRVRYENSDWGGHYSIRWVLWVLILMYRKYSAARQRCNLLQEMDKKTLEFGIKKLWVFKLSLERRSSCCSVPSAVWREHYRLVADTLTHIKLSYLHKASKILSMHHFLFISVSYYTLTVVDNFMYNIRLPSYIV